MNYDLPPPPPVAAVSNISDLSYRNYEGPIHSRTGRWWTIAKSGIRSIIKRPAFWVAIAFCVIPYMLHAFGFYLTEQARSLGAGASAMLGDPAEKFGQLFYVSLCGNINEISTFVIALLMGAGSIAADNRANALMVYLSKPITKGDYLFGKWMGLFLILWMVALVPCMMLFLYCTVLYASDGFLKENPTLIWRVLASSLVPPLMHTSLLIGLSAWSKSPRMVGAIYAAIYFVGGILAFFLGISLYPNNPAMNNLVQHFSLTGVMDGLVQNLLHITAPPPILMRTQPDDPMLAIPILAPLAVIAGLIVVGGILAARTKIRAVEVVTG